eukprot:jgi/Hompol1/5611/HPOL_004574-RA
MDLVRLAIFMEGSRTPLRRADIITKVLKEHARGLPVFVQKAQQKLKETFGMDLVILPKLTQRRKGRRPGAAQ